MTLQQLIYFREVARELHFSRAADNLYVAQSSLSHAIQELESEIGAPLFLRRNGKKIQLTTYGKAFLPYVEHSLSELERGRNELDQLISPNSGIVRIAYSYMNGVNIMPYFLNWFYDQTENQDISVRQVVNHGGKAFIEECLAQCDADLALSTWPFLESQHVQSVFLTKQEQFAVVPIKHPLSSKDKIKLEDLAGEKIIMFSGAYGLYDYTVELFRRAKVPVTFVDGCTDWSTVLMEVVRGEGIAIQPETDIFHDEVVFLPLDTPGNMRNVYLLWPKDRKLSKAAEYTRKFILELYNVQ